MASNWKNSNGPARRLRTARSVKLCAVGLGSVACVIADTIARWVTGENPKAPPIGKPMKPKDCPSCTRLESPTTKAGAGMPSMRNTAKSRAGSLTTTLADRNCQSPSALRTCTAKAGAPTGPVPSGTTWALVTTKDPSPTAKPVPLSWNRGLSVALNATSPDDFTDRYAMVDTAVKNAPAGTESAVALVKSAVAAANNAYESVHKAAKQATEVAEANFNALTTQAVKATAAPKGRKAA